MLGLQPGFDSASPWEQLEHTKYAMYSVQPHTTCSASDPSKVTDPDADSFDVSFMPGGTELTITAVDNQKQEIRVTAQVEEASCIPE